MEAPVSYLQAHGPAAFAHPRIDIRPLDGELATDPGGDAMCEFADLGGITESQIDAFEAPEAFDEHLCWAVYQYIRDPAVIQERLQHAKPKELRTERFELVLGQITRRRRSDPLAQHQPSRGIHVEREHRAGIET
jgi:hypothetical protein